MVHPALFEMGQNDRFKAGRVCIFHLVKMVRFFTKNEQKTKRNDFFL